MPEKIVLNPGDRFGRLTVVSPGPRKGRNATWVCVCDCGKTVVRFSCNLRNGSTSSCGCYQAEQRRKRTRSYWLTYYTWVGMIVRCTKPEAKGYEHYGGRGIRVCPRWLESFENFLTDMGEKEEGLSIDRIDVNGDYEPNNCRWASDDEQANNRRSSAMLTYKGRTQTMAQWGKEFDIDGTVLSSRIKAGWDAGKALTTPVRKLNRCR
jgi:hypothetical protein